MYRRILVPLDGSGLAEAALQHAEDLCRRSQGQLILLRVVVSPYAIVAPDLMLAGSDPDMELLSAHAKAYLAGIVKRLQEQGVEARAIISEGPIAEAILDHAISLDVDLIVMSTHGRGGVRRWVYGSVAERVLQGADCPLLLIRADHTAR